MKLHSRESYIITDEAHLDPEKHSRHCRDNQKL